MKVTVKKTWSDWSFKEYQQLVKLIHEQDDEIKENLEKMFYGGKFESTAEFHEVVGKIVQICSDIDNWQKLMPVDLVAIYLNCSTFVLSALKFIYAGHEPREIIAFELNGEAYKLRLYAEILDSKIPLPDVSALSYAQKCDYIDAVRKSVKQIELSPKVFTSHIETLPVICACAVMGDEDEETLSRFSKDCESLDMQTLLDVFFYSIGLMNFVKKHLGFCSVEFQ